jgi:hypothetical protein
VAAALAILTGLLAFAAPAGAATESISGTVTDSAGNPVTDFCVTATRFGGSGSLVLAPVRTQIDGTFTISGPNVTPSTYTLRYSVCQNGGSGPPSNFDLIPEYWDDQPDAGSASQFTVGEDQAVVGMDAVLQIGARISGTISGPGGPMAGCVSLYGPGIASGIQTASSGTYSYTKLRAGEYTMRFGDCSNPAQLATEWYEHKPTRSQATKINLVDAQVLNGVDVTLSPGGMIAGTVTGPAGEPVKDVCVTVFDGDGEQAVRVYTNASGEFSGSGLFPAAYRVLYADCNHRSNVASEYYEDAGSLGVADEVVVTAGQTSQASAQLARGGSISGVVRGPDQLPLADACVTAYDGLGSTLSYTETAVDGSYLLGSLETGDYRVKFDTCGAVDGDDIIEFWRDQSTLAAADQISVTSGADSAGTNATLGATDPVAPQTTIGTGPGAGSRLSVANATFSFTSSIAGSTFACRLDAGPWQPCTSPLSLASLPDGSHSFAVRATSPALLTDGTPARRTFRVAVGPCAQARAGLPRAKARLAAANAKVANAGRKLKSARRSGNSTKVRVTKKKLKKAERIRRAAKRALTAAQAAVAQRCGST